MYYCFFALLDNCRVNKNTLNAEKKKSSNTPLFQKINKLMSDQNTVISKNIIDRLYIFLFDFCRYFINKYKDTVKEIANATATITCNPLNRGKCSIAGIMTVNMRKTNDRISKFFAFLFSNDFNIYSLSI